MPTWEPCVPGRSLGLKRQSLAEATRGLQLRREMRPNCAFPRRKNKGYNETPQQKADTMPTKLVIAQTTVRVLAAVAGSILAKSASDQINSQLAQTFGSTLDSEA